MDDETLERLRAVPYFEPLTTAELTAFAKNVSQETFAPRELVLSGDGPTPGLFFVVRGKARIYRIGRDGREQTLRIVAAGDTFGEVPVFDGGPAPAWVEALETLVVLVVPVRAFRQLVAQQPGVALSLLQHFSRRIRTLTRQVEQMSLQSVEGRLSRYLVQVAEAEGRQTSEGIVIPRELTHQDLATVVGSVREVVSRTLKTLERDGIIKIERDRLIILDSDRLGAAR